MLPGWFHTAKKVGSAYDRGRLPLVGGLAGRAVAARLPDSLDLRDIGVHVAGMICIRLIAPAEETARFSGAFRTHHRPEHLRSERRSGVTPRQCDRHRHRAVKGVRLA